MLKQFIEAFKEERRKNKQGCNILLVVVVIALLFFFYLITIDYKPFVDFMDQPIKDVPFWAILLGYAITKYMMDRDKGDKDE
jgi:hypothetical protein